MRDDDITLPIVRQGPEGRSVGNGGPAGPGELAHPWVTFAWLVIVAISAVVPVLKRVLGHFAR